MFRGIGELLALRVEAERPLVRLIRLLAEPEHGQRLAKVEPGKFELRVQAHSVAKDVGGLGGALQAYQHKSQVLVRLGERRRDPDGLPQRLLGLLQAIELEQNSAT